MSERACFGKDAWPLLDLIAVLTFVDVVRLKAVEDSVRGKPANAETGEMAGKLAVQGAIPLQFNAYKIPLMRNLVKRAIGGVQEAQWA